MSGPDSRELALLLWIGALFVFLLMSSKMRPQVVDLAKQVFASKLTILFASMLVYVLGLVWVLNQIGIWTGEQVTELIFWFFGPGLAAIWNYGDGIRDPHFLRRSVIRAVEVAVLVQFVINLYPFNLVVELILVPIFATLGGVIALADHKKEEYRQLGVVLKVIAAILGLTLLANGIAHIAGDTDAFLSATNLRDLMVPVCLTIGFIPFVYLFAVYTAYERIFVRIGIFVDNDDVRRYAKWQALKVAGLGFKRIRTVCYLYPRRLHHGVTAADVDRIIQEVKSGEAAPSASEARDPLEK